GLQRDVPGPVDRVARGLQHVAHHDLVDGGGGHSRALQRGPGRVRPQVEGGDVLEGAHLLGHGRPRAPQEHDLTRHGCRPRRKPQYSIPCLARAARHRLATMRTSRLVLALLLVSIAACNRDYPNPFSQATTSHPPPASAAIIFTSGQWSTDPGAGREVYAMNLDGSGLTQLTNCNGGDTPCDTAEVSPAPDRIHVYSRRSLGSPPSLPSLVFLDLGRSVGTEVIPSSLAASSVDWSPLDGVVIYTARGEGGTEDLFAMDP